MQRHGERPSQRRLADHTGLEPLYVSKLARSLESAGLLERTRDPRDPRAVQLALTEQGQARTRQAIEVVQGLLQQLLAPLGGLGSARTRDFTRELTTLLDVPLDPFVDVPLDPFVNGSESDADIRTHDSESEHRQSEHRQSDDGQSDKEQS